MAEATSIAVAVTTAPRKKPTLTQCLGSLRRAGFGRIRIYAEPDSPLDGVFEGCEVIQRTYKHGAWRNWLLSALDMVERSNADGILMVQDDTYWRPGARKFLEHDLWPNKNTGYIQCVPSSGYKPKGKRGLVRIDQARVNVVLGAWGTLFPRRSLARIVHLGLERGWKGCRGRKFEPDAAKRYNLDGFIGHSCRALGMRAYFYNPAMAQHLARDSNSTLGHDEKRGWRLRIRFALNYQDSDVRDVTPRNKNRVTIP